jgi:hypothetical protein
MVCLQQTLSGFMENKAEWKMAQMGDVVAQWVESTMGDT